MGLSQRYSGSFNDFVKHDNSCYFNRDLGHARNSVFQLTLGYLITTK